MPGIEDILGGAPSRPAMPGGPGPGMAPPPRPAAPAPAPRGNPLLKQVVMGNLDQPGRENISFVFVDGVRSTNTMPELMQMGVPQQAISAFSRLLEQVGTVVHQTNGGSGGPNPHLAPPPGGAPPQGMA